MQDTTTTKPAPKTAPKATETVKRTAGQRKLISLARRIEGRTTALAAKAKLVSIEPAGKNLAAMRTLIQEVIAAGAELAALGDDGEPLPSAISKTQAAGPHS